MDHVQVHVEMDFINMMQNYVNLALLAVLPALMEMHAINVTMDLL